MADAKQILILGGLGLGVLALIAFASPAQSKIQLGPARNPGTPPPNLPPPPPPPLNIPGIPQTDTADAAIAAAIATAIAAQAANASPGSLGAPPQGAPAAQALLALPLPNPMPLVQGQRYRARLELSGFETLADRAMLKSTFEGLGFSNINIAINQTELPPGWPLLALANITGSSRWAEGTWNQPSQLVPKPSQIQNAWIG